MLKTQSQFFAFAAIFMLLLAFLPGKAEAACACGAYLSCAETTCLHRETRKQVKDFIDDQYEKHTKFMVEQYWEQNILPALMKMAEQLTASQSASTERQASFNDRENSHEKIEGVNEVVAEAAIERRPGDGLCTAATATREALPQDAEAQAAAAQIAQAGLASSTQGSGSVNATTQTRTAAMKEILCRDIDPTDSAKQAFCETETGSEETDPVLAVMNADQIVVGQEGEGEDTPAGKALFAQDQILFVNPIPEVTAETLENQTTRMALIRARSLNAQMRLASYCYMQTLSDRMVLEEQEPSPERVALREEIGLDQEAIEERGMSKYSLRQDRLMRNLSAPAAADLIGPESAALQQAVMTESNRTADAYDLLKAAQCNELMTALLLNQRLAPYRDRVQEGIDAITAYNNFLQPDKRIDVARANIQEGVK